MKSEILNFVEQSFSPRNTPLSRRMTDRSATSLSASRVVPISQYEPRNKTMRRRSNMNIDSQQNSFMDRCALLRSGFWTRIMKRSSAFRPKLFLILLGTVFVSANTAVNATTSFTLSGSPDGTATILVDDDLDVYLDGAQIYTDGTNSAGNRPPIHFSADGGSSVRIVVRDTYGDCSLLSPIYLTSSAT